VLLGLKAWPAALRKPLLVSSGLTLAALALYIRPERVDFSAGGPAIFVFATGIACAAGMPRQAAAFAGAYAYGFTPGLVLSLAAQLLGCSIDFYWARSAAQDWTQRRLGRKLARLDRFVSNNPFATTLMFRLLPLGSNVALNLFAGLSGMSASRFFAATALGYLPQSIIFALLGNGVRLQRTTQLELAAALFAFASLIGFSLARRPAQPTGEEPA